MNIREDGIPNTVSIDRNTLIPRGIEETSPDASRGKEARNQDNKDARSDSCEYTTEKT